MVSMYAFHFAFKFWLKIFMQWARGYQASWVVAVQMPAGFMGNVVHFESCHNDLPIRHGFCCDCFSKQE